SKRDWSSDVCSSDLDGKRRANANRLNGIDAEWLDPEGVAEVCPIVDVSPDVRHPVLGATFQPRGGIARHENVAWGYARAADLARSEERPVGKARVCA